jgi:phospholipase/carboxylesterase
VDPFRAVLSPFWPDAASPSDSPVVLLLHGLGSNEHDLPSLAPFLPDGLAWASLRAPIEMEWGGASWFPLSSPVEPEQAGVDAATSLIWAWVDEQVPPKANLILLGFSQGGFMAIELLRSRPERVQAMVVLSGLMAKEAHPTDATLSESRPPAFWGRGTADTRIWPEAVESLGRWLRDHTTLTERVYLGLGHGINDDEMDNVRAFLADQVP